MIRVPSAMQSIMLPTARGSPDLGRFILNYPPGTLKHVTPLNNQARQFEMQRLPIFDSTEQMRDFLTQNKMTGTTFRVDVAELMSRWFRPYENGPDDLIDLFTAVIDQFIEMWACGIQLGSNMC